MTKIKMYVVNYTGKKKGSGSKANQEKYSIFASAAYKTDKKKYLDKYNMKSWEVDKSLSKPFATVFVNKNTGEVVIGGRGTSSWDPFDKSGDFWANVSILTGSKLFSSREKQYEKLYQKTRKKYPTNDLSLVGHSQSGYYSSEIAKKHKEKAYVFNSASPPRKKSIMDTFFKDNYTEHYTTNNISKGNIDLVSILSTTKDKTSVDVKTKSDGSKDSHSIKNFLPDKKSYKGEGKKDNSKKYCRKCKRYISKIHYARHIKSKTHLG